MGDDEERKQQVQKIKELVGDLKKSGGGRKGAKLAEEIAEATKQLPRKES